MVDDRPIVLLLILHLFPIYLQCLSFCLTFVSHGEQRLLMIHFSTSCLFEGLLWSLLVEMECSVFPHRWTGSYGGWMYSVSALNLLYSIHIGTSQSFYICVCKRRRVLLPESLLIGLGQSLLSENADSFSLVSVTSVRPLKWWCGSLAFQFHAAAATTTEACLTISVNAFYFYLVLLVVCLMDKPVKASHLTAKFVLQPGGRWMIGGI